MDSPVNLGPRLGAEQAKQAKADLRGPILAGRIVQSVTRDSLESLAKTVPGSTSLWAILDSPVNSDFPQVTGLAKQGSRDYLDSTAVEPTCSLATMDSLDLMGH